MAATTTTQPLHFVPAEHEQQAKQKHILQDQMPLQLDTASHWSMDLNTTKKSLTALDMQMLDSLQKFHSCSNFIAASMLYLKDNFLLKEPLKPDHVKDRLLGHWGTVPGITFVYAQCNYWIKQNELNSFLVVGPGHGAPAILSAQYLTGELSKYYPQYTHDYEGLSKLVKAFCWPSGFPSHVNAEYPGSIHEGGELGYALSVSYGAVMNHPDLIVTCLVGDGEAETGPTSTSWHCHKWIDPKESGAVLPILHLNGYKITSPTIFGTMSDFDLYQLFSGYGYQVRIVQHLEEIEVEMFAAMEWALSEIRKIQKAARIDNAPIHKPRWPMIVLKTPKGWSGIKRFHGKKIEGSYRAHQIPLKDCKQDLEELTTIEKWLRSYDIPSLFDMESGKVKDQVLQTVPPDHLKMAWNTLTNPPFEPLKRPNIFQFEVKIDSEERGKVITSPTHELGKYVEQLWKMNPDRFKIFSPDELESNKLDPIFNSTHRNYQWYKNPQKTNCDGAVLEILSEHTCQGWAQGFTLTGRYSLFPSYETFLGIVTTMMVQYAKFQYVASSVKWRNPTPALTYIETSTLWRQEHNGFSHQNPGFLNSLLNMKTCLVRVYLPPDANCLICTFDHCMRQKKYINLIVSTKVPEQTWLTMEEAVAHCRVGASIFKWASTDEGLNPDIVLVGIGNEVNTEVIAAAMLLRKHVPHMRVRLVNVTDLMIFDHEREHPHFLTTEKFNALFTESRPILINFHGYPSAVKQLLYGRPNTAHRTSILGYKEEGTTTTPFHMLTCNQVDRYHVCIKAIEMVMPFNEHVAIDSTMQISYFQHMLRLHQEYILEHGSDPKELEQVIVNAKELKKVYNERSEHKKKLLASGNQY